MSGWLGIPAWAWLVIALLVAASAVYLWRSRRLGLPSRTPWPRRREPTAAETSAPHTHGRLTVLETASVDSRRKLLLVRCDDVEHLIMVGGPADLVVEHDIRRRPVAAASAAAVAAGHPIPPAVVARREEAARPLELDADRAVRPTRAVEIDKRKAARPDPASPAPIRPDAASPQPARSDAPQPMPVRPALAAVSASAAPKASQAAPSPALAAPASVSATPAAAPAPASVGPERMRRAETPRVVARPNGASGAAADSRPLKRSTEVPAARRETLSALRRAQPTPAAQAAPVVAGPTLEPVRLQPVASREAPAGEPRARAARDANGDAAAREAPKPGGLPPAGVPWPDTDSVETEIVQALHAEPGSAEKKEPREPAKAKSASSSTTLGDLADRLEEALAREVQAANHSRSRLDLNLDAFGFGREKPKERTEPKLRPEPALPTAAPEPEARQESRPAPERQDETPVISLNARRREPVDPLEDEMARLLGELTGDTGRR
jgi:hypothetical protein